MATFELQNRRRSQDEESEPSITSTPPNGISDEGPSEDNQFSLPPVDGGKDAWLFLGATFVLEALVWGFPFAFGIFQDYYRSHEPFAGSTGIVAIGTCAVGIMYLDMPLIIAIQQLYPRATRWCPLIGLVTMCLSLVTSSFSQTTTHLIVTQGVLYAICGSLCYCPCLLYMEEWFIRRKGLAYGVMWSGTGLGGFVFPLLLEFLLGRYGFRTTLRIWAGTLFALTVPIIYFIKPRLPISTSTHVKTLQFSFLLQPTYILFQISVIVESMGYFLPAIYLPTYARTILGAGSFGSALTVILINVASVFGVVTMGMLVDRLHVTTCILISTVGAVLVTMLLWGFAINLPLLYTFCVMYGIFAGSYASSWPGIMRQVVSDTQARNMAAGESAATNMADPLMVFGLLSAGRGVGNVTSGPLSEALIRGMPWKGKALGAWGSGYGILVTFTGVTALIGGSSFLWRKQMV